MEDAAAQPEALRSALQMLEGNCELLRCLTDGQERRAVAAKLIELAASLTEGAAAVEQHEVAPESRSHDDDADLSSSVSSSRRSSSMVVAVENGISGPSEKTQPRLISFIEEVSINDVSLKVRNEAMAHSHPFMLNPTSSMRTVWDLLIAFLILYILIMVPLAMGYLSRQAKMDKSSPLGVLDVSVDVIFVADILINLRTGFLLETGVLVMDPGKSCRHYLKTWFAFDLVSSLPPILEVLVRVLLGGGSKSGAVASQVSALKILKLGRAVKALRVLRVGRLLALLDEDTELADEIDDFLSSSLYVLIAKVTGLLSMAFVVAHLLACFMAASGDGFFLEAYASVHNGRTADEWSWERQYLVGLYWAFTTMTTVGYGDVTPKSDQERFYVIIAMGVGVSFYSYIIASVASMVTASDAKSASVYEKMDVLSAWMNHYSVDRILRRKIRKYYQRYYAHHFALDEQSILENMVPGLQDAVTAYILDANVASHKLFSDMPSGTLWKIAMIVRLAHYPTGTLVVQQGAPTADLHVLKIGECSLRHNNKDNVLVPGDSFGELCFLGIGLVSLVSVRTTTPADFSTIHRENFIQIFLNLPDVQKKIDDHHRLFADRAFTHKSRKKSDAMEDSQHWEKTTSSSQDTDILNFENFKYLAAAAPAPRTFV